MDVAPLAALLEREHRDLDALFGRFLAAASSADAAAARDAKLAIVDLRMPAALAALDALAAGPAPSEGQSKVRTVGFIDHERVEVMDEARAKGCTDVMAKGQFANALPKLLAGLSAS